MNRDRGVPRRIVGIGGGTGLPVLLSGLAGLREGDGRDPEVSAIVTVADSGGSTGTLRRELEIPAVGDLRNCMVALAAAGSPLGELFQHRFPNGDGLEGHALGNLIVAASLQRSRTLLRAVDELSGLLEVAGRVLPVTESPVHLCAEFDDGSVVRGESEIRRIERPIRRVWLEPDDPAPSPGVLEAIATADAVVLGPGSLYTSLVPNLLVSGVGDALRRSRALKIFVCNLMSEPGETDGMAAEDYLHVLADYLGRRPVDVCVLNSAPLREEVAGRYSAEGASPVSWNDREIVRMGILPVASDLLDADGKMVRHEPRKLAQFIVSLLAGELRGPDAVLRFDPSTLGGRRRVACGAEAGSTAGSRFRALLDNA